MKPKPVQISFLEYLVNDEKSFDESLGKIFFPKGFEVRNIKHLRFEFEKLANRYGLTLPATLKKGNLVLEWKLLPGELDHNLSTDFKNHQVKQQTLNLTSEEVSAFSNIFSSAKEN